mgnify:CR=1 FL=1
MVVQQLPEGEKAAVCIDPSLAELAKLLFKHVSNLQIRPDHKEYIASVQVMEAMITTQRINVDRTWDPQLQRTGSREQENLLLPAINEFAYLRR